MPTTAAPAPTATDRAAAIQADEIAFWSQHHDPRILGATTPEQHAERVAMRNLADLLVAGITPPDVSVEVYRLARAAANEGR